MINSFYFILYTALFVSPGYFMMECCNCVYKSDALSEKEKMVRGISYSLLLSMVWIPFYADPENIQKITSYKVLLTTFLLSHLVALLLGIFIGCAKKNCWARKVFSHLPKPIYLLHPAPTAWDYQFSKEDVANKYVEVGLKNGKIIKGYFSYQSFASSDRDYRDLYLETFHRTTCFGKWEDVPCNAGIWINPDSIQYIKFYKGSDQNEILEQKTT